jgi:phage tail tape-measure protein
MSDLPSTNEPAAEVQNQMNPADPPGSPAMEQLGTHALGTAAGVIGGIVAGAVVGIAAGPVGSLAGAIGGAIGGGMLGSGSVGKSPVTGPAVEEHPDPVADKTTSAVGRNQPSVPAE